MKKIFLSLLILAICGMATAQTLSVADVYVMPGGTASFGLKVNVGSGKYDSYQFKMTFPKTGFSLTGNTTSIDSWDAPLLTGAWTVGETNASANASAFSAAGTAIPSGDIILGTVEFEAASSLEAGQEYEVTISEFEFISSGVGTPVDPVTFTVHITNRVVLDEDSEVLPANQNGVDVLVKRTIKKDVWSTICLPFAMDEAQVKEVFGDGVKVAEFVDFGQDATAFTVNFEESDIASDGFAANWPYIIKSEKDLTEFTVSNVNVAAYEDDALAEYETGKGSKKKTVGTFQGTLKAGTVIPENNLFLANNKFYYSTGSTTIKGFRGYFWLEGFDGSSMAPIFNVDGEATNIDGLQIVNGDGRIYNLNGQHVENPTKKGVYIQNGKKVVIKK